MKIDIHQRNLKIYIGYFSCHILWHALYSWDLVIYPGFFLFIQSNPGYLFSSISRLELLWTRKINDQYDHVFYVVYAVKQGMPVKYRVCQSSIGYGSQVGYVSQAVYGCQVGYASQEGFSVK